MEINAENVYIGAGAFGHNDLLTNVTIRSKVVHMGASVFSEEAPLTHVMFNKSATVISGLPSNLYKKYACDEAESKCGCHQGYENSLPESSPFFSCTPCESGFSNSIIANQGLCTQCTPGRYANHTASAICEQCESGKYGSSFGASDANDCKSCVPGKYASATGSSELVWSAPLVVLVLITAPLHIYHVLSADTTVSQVQTNCSACPQGKYGPYKGAAICLDCPKGKFGPLTGSTALDECEDCPAGKYSSSDGSYSCTSCSKSEYQPEKGQSSCLECPGVGEIGDAKRTGCMTDPSIAKLRTQHSLKNYFPRESLFTSLSLSQRYLLLPSFWSTSKRLGSITCSAIFSIAAIKSIR